MGWFLLRDTQGEFGVFPDSSLLGVFDKPGDDPATFVVLGRDGRPCDLTVENVWTYHSLADALDGLVAEKAEAMRVAMHGTVRNCRVCGCDPFPKPGRRDGQAPCNECHLQPGEKCDVCGAVEPETRAASVAILGGPCPHCGARSQGNVFNCHACGKPFEGDPREPDGFPAPTGDAMRDLQRIDAHLGETAAEKLAALPETRQLPIAHGQGLSPLQDGNHPEIEAHRQRLREAAGDPMASAKALLARKDAKP